jgi:hypothetical protein
LAHVLLPKVAADFVLTYPQVELEIVAEDREVDPVEDNYDLVLRVDPNHDERLVGRRIVEDQRLLVAPPWVHVALRLEHEDGACGWRYAIAYPDSCVALPADLPSCLAKMKPSFRHLLSVAVIPHGRHPELIIDAFIQHLVSLSPQYNVPYW